MNEIFEKKKKEKALVKTQQVDLSDAVGSGRSMGETAEEMA